MKLIMVFVIPRQVAIEAIVVLPMVIAMASSMVSIIAAAIASTLFIPSS
jgi:hypothetical protein